jgi:hypothetical protein
MNDANANSSMATWELEDLQAWEALMRPSTALNALFMDALRKEFAVCIPPDSALNGQPLDEKTMRMHILVPSPVLQDHYTVLSGEPEAEKGFTLFKKTPRGATPRGGATPATTPPAGPSPPENTVRKVTDPSPVLICEGPAWPGGPATIAILFEDEIRTGEGTARVMVLAKSLTDNRKPNLAANAAAMVSLFGDSKDDNAMTASDTLFRLDRTGELMRCINSELQSFRDHYEPVGGYEEDLFSRVKSIAEMQARRWVHVLGSNFVSYKRSMRSTVLAVHTYVHARMYQFVFPAMCAIEAEASAEFEVGSDTIRNAGRTLLDFEVPAGLAQAINMVSLERLFDRFNVATTPFDKVQVACLIMDTITTLITRASSGEAVGADLLVPVLALSLALYPPRDMAAQVAYMERFLPNEALSGGDESRSYALVSFRAALEYIRRYSDEGEVKRRMSQSDVTATFIGRY